MEQIELNATLRENTGKGPARVLRRDGRMPAVLYGPDQVPMLLSINVKELEKISKKHNLSQVPLNLLLEIENRPPKK